MKVLITGAGRIGCAVARQFQARGDDVVLISPSVDNVGARAGLCIKQVDVTDWDALCALVREHEVQAVVHTAAVLTPAFASDPLTAIRVNVQGTANVLELARQFKLRRVVLAGSTTVSYSVFGSLPVNHPIAEDFPMRVLSERPGSLYACTKLGMEHLALGYVQQFGVDAVVLRIGAVLGPEENQASSVPGKMLETLLDAARSGNPARFEDPRLLWGGREEFVDVRDCARAVQAALDAAAPLQRVYNIVSGEWFSFPEFVEVVRTSFPSLRVAETELPSTGFSNFPFQRPAPSSMEAARRELGFTPRYGLAETIRHVAGADQPSLVAAAH